jgi:hypothetical protein
MVYSHRHRGVQLLEGLYCQRQTRYHSARSRYQPTPGSAIRQHRRRRRYVVLGVVFLQRLRYELSQFFFGQREVKPFFPEESVLG